MPNDNPFDEFFRKLIEGEDSGPDMEQIKKDMDHASKIAFMLHMSYLTAGFTVDQAFELTKLQLSAAAKK